MRVAEEYLQKEMGFQLSQIQDLGIRKVSKTRKVDRKTIYITLKNNEEASKNESKEETKDIESHPAYSVVSYGKPLNRKSRLHETMIRHRHLHFGS